MQEPGYPGTLGSLAARNNAFQNKGCKKYTAGRAESCETPQTGYTLSGTTATRASDSDGSEFNFNC
jgi:hypothetical protein